MGDPYTTLGVTSSATEEEISKAYKKLARQYHPDLHPGDRTAEAKMKEINAAYEEIKDIRAGRKPSYSTAGSSYGGRDTDGSGYSEYTDPFGSYRGTYSGSYYGFDFSEFFAEAQKQRERRRSASYGFFGIIRSVIKFSVIMWLLRLFFSLFFYPVF